DRALFLERHWERQALLLSSDAAGPRRHDLRFDVGAVKRAAARARPGSLAATYTTPHGRLVSTDIAPSQVGFCRRGGATINLRRAHLIDAELARWAEALRSDLAYPGEVEAFVFWSPPGGGLSLHFDDSGGFAFQLAGVKRWRHGTRPAWPGPP